MLQKDADKRFTLQQVKKHPWTICRHPKTQEEVPIPPLKGHKWHSMTVLPYLMEYHYGGDDNPTYYTEHQLNGMYFYSFFFLVRFSALCYVLLYLCIKA